MSNITIDQAKVDQFSSNVFHLSQQKESRFKPLVRNESLKGESGYFDRYGSTNMVKKTGRHSATPLINVDHSRRKVTAERFEWATLVDDMDKVQMIHDPQGEYAKAASMAAGRKIDDVIIEAAIGTAYAGRTGGTSVPFPNSQKVVAHDGSTATGVNLNIRTLRAVKKKLDKAEVDPSIKRYFAYASEQEMSLLAQTEVTSSDYNTVKALVQGEVNSFMGFEFIRTERLAAESANVTYNVVNGTYGSGTGTITISTSPARKCFAWAMDGLLLAIRKDVMAKIGERPDLSYDMQVYFCMDKGATRMEEEKVVEVICAEL